MANKLRPLNDYIFLKEETEKETESGILLSKELNTQSIGEVFAVAENKHGLKKGDRVIFSKFVSEDIELDEGNEKLKLKACPVDSLLAIL